MDRIPPRITTAVRKVMIMPVHHGEILNVSLTSEAMELACTILPIPNAATAVKAAKTIPNQRHFMPRSKTYIGPPAMTPCEVVILYLTDKRASEYLVAIPKTPVSHIHNTAPGRPEAIAVATPTIFPVPIVAARAVVNAPNWLTSPSPSFPRPREILIAWTM